MLDLRFSNWGPGTPRGARGQWKCLHKKCKLNKKNKKFDYKKNKYSVIKFK